MQGAARTGGALLVDLARAIGARFGARTGGGAPRLPEALRDAIAGARSIVVFLIDGAGVAQIRAHAPDGMLARSLVSAATTVFPTSTAPALTAFATGLDPLAHGNPGWFVWSERHASVVRSLLLDVRGQPHVAVAAQELWDWTPLSSRIEVPMAVHQPRSIADSAFSRFAYAGADRIGYESVEELPQRIADGVAAGYGYQYAYCPDFDAIAHAAGCRSAAAGHVLRRLDATYARVAAALADTDALLLATADHGFIDVPDDRQLRLADYPEVTRLLEGPISGEPRVGLARVAPGGAAMFEQAVREHLGFAVDAVPSARLIERGWFGASTDGHDRRARFGTHVLLCRDGYTLVDSVVGERPPAFIGMHGGPSDDERRVPLCAARHGRALRDA